MPQVFYNRTGVSLCLQAVIADDPSTNSSQASQRLSLIEHAGRIGSTFDRLARVANGWQFCSHAQG